MLDEVAKSLQLNTKPSCFCTKVTDSYESLKIAVKDFGELKFPITATMVKKLIKVAKPAEFGWRDKTIYDPKVRKNWKILGDHLEIDEKKWEKTLHKIVQEMQKELGLPEESKLEAELHDLLIYEPGDFFAGHKDTEKAEGMIGTLVVLLPSDFKGGSLVVQQQNEKKIFRSTQKTGKNLTFIAFYADCYHEVKKVTSGYRITLTYNLILKNKVHLLQQSNDKLLNSVRCYFEDVPKTEKLSYRDSEPKWLVYLLDHEYSKKSLNWPQLKGLDRDRASMLLDIADKLNLTIHLALADMHETWDVEYDYSYSRRRRWGYRSYDDDEKNIDDIEKGNLIENECELHTWINRDNQKVSLPNHSIFGDSICCTKENEEMSPYESEYEGWMGNYGNTIDYWYHRAAIILWQKDDEYSNMFRISPIETLKNIKKILQQDIQKGRDILEKILPQWSYQVREDASGLENTFEIAAIVKDKELAAKLLDIFCLENMCTTIKTSLNKALETYGESWGVDLLKKLSAKNRSYYPVFLKDLLPLVKSIKSKYPKIALWMLQYQFSAIKQGDQLLLKESDRRIQKEMTKNSKQVKDFLLSVCELDNKNVHIKAMEHFLANNNIYTPEISSKILRQVHVSWDKDKAEKWGYDKWFTEILKRLEKQTATKRQKGDWSITERIHCNCNDCKILRTFLEDGKETQYIWPLAQQRRRHIHNIINDMDIPVTHKTERTGSPHKLILTKTPNLFKNAEKEHDSLVKEMKQLQQFRGEAESKKTKRKK